MRPLVVCADQYGLAHGVCDAALDLVAMERVSAITAVVDGIAFRKRAADLAKLPPSVGVGLFLGFGGASATSILRDVAAGRLDRDATITDLRRQIAAFREGVGRDPSFLGSPGEVHTLPVLRDAVLLALGLEAPSSRLWLRDPSEPLVRRLRRGIGLLRASIASWGAVGFRRAAAAKGHSTNRGYAGFLPRAEPAGIPSAIERMLSDLGPAPILVTRPAYRDAALERLDPGADRRERALFYLSSGRFADLLEVARLDLVPAPQIVHKP